MCGCADWAAGGRCLRVCLCQPTGVQSSNFFQGLTALFLFFCFHYSVFITLCSLPYFLLSYFSLFYFDSWCSIFISLFSFLYFHSWCSVPLYVQLILQTKTPRVSLGGEMGRKNKENGKPWLRLEYEQGCGRHAAVLQNGWRGWFREFVGDRRKGFQSFI